MCLATKIGRGCGNRPQGIALADLFALDRLGGVAGEPSAGTVLRPPVALREGVKEHYNDEAWEKIRPGQY